MIKRLCHFLHDDHYVRFVFRLCGHAEYVLKDHVKDMTQSDWCDSCAGKLDELERGQKRIGGLPDSGMGFL